ncbi:hypothetical protein ACS7SF_17480 [Ralstonia sp. 25C]|uniref:hypothetical protein n=1 Tax=Ralstonia sp. 25C TaxID=3447363 RepID=UPI003F74FD9E
MRSPTCGMNLAMCLGWGAALVLTGCETPRHSNTLIFGTSTKVAIDASQEPTGALGVTIGYKRNEAVWMPLIANKANGDKLVPEECGNDDCRKFQGLAGTSGGAAGAGAQDTYSVLATFSGNMSATAQNPEAKGSLAQYFATGIAARLLAQYGGAAVVNTGASETKSAAIGATAQQTLDVKSSRVATVVTKVTKTNGQVDEQAVTKLLSLSPAKDIGAADQTAIRSMKTRAALDEYLHDAPESIANRLYSTLDQL